MTFGNVRRSLFCGFCRALGELALNWAHGFVDCAACRKHKPKLVIAQFFAECLALNFGKEERADKICNNRFGRIVFPLLHFVNNVVELTSTLAHKLARLPLRSPLDGIANHIFEISVHSVLVHIDNGAKHLVLPRSALFFHGAPTALLCLAHPTLAFRQTHHRSNPPLFLQTHKLLAEKVERVGDSGTLSRLECAAGNGLGMPPLRALLLPLHCRLPLRIHIALARTLDRVRRPQLADEFQPALLSIEHPVLHGASPKKLLQKNHGAVHGVVCLGRHLDRRRRRAWSGLFDARAELEGLWGARLLLLAFSNGLFHLAKLVLNMGFAALSGPTWLARAKWHLDHRFKHACRQRPLERTEALICVEVH
eukprot:Opistho-2@61879